MLKLLIALLVAYAGWRLWKDGFGGTKAKKRVVPREPSDAAAARRLLGVDRAADTATIRAAHRRLMAEAHPDRGGSAEEARALNAARDLLLGRAG
ncbi:DnaJ domain-containing protein [Sphingomonas sp. IC4-52]|uniref:DnaJ domain-containing protein n=1 Tax=Sphingomonas sp. IC4-52 TaxID=2887202 RepID=UPI001D1271E3|nr:DnaJ domain-containing protein [Sphingomonas sp. IC4-52]MCC2980528.1 J domain-containing protein [Sphingomonas sp. IC4-52]